MITIHTTGWWSALMIKIVQGCNNDHVFGKVARYGDKNFFTLHQYVLNSITFCFLNLTVANTYSNMIEIGN